MNNSILSICPDKLGSRERHVLLTANDYEVVSVDSVDEALLLLEERSFGAVLLDSHFAKDAANLSLLRSKCRVLSLKFPMEPTLLLHAIDALLLSRRQPNRQATAVLPGS